MRRKAYEIKLHSNYLIADDGEMRSRKIHILNNAVIIPHLLPLGVSDMNYYNFR